MLAPIQLAGPFGSDGMGYCDGLMTPAATHCNASSYSDAVYVTVSVLVATTG